MVKRKSLLVITIAISVFCAVFTACDKSSSNSGNISIKRYEKLLFETPAENLPEVLRQNEYEYRYLLNEDLNNPMYMRQIVDFASDPLMKQVFETSQKHYADLAWLENDLQKPIQKTQELFPNLCIKYFYTLITGSFDYNMRVISVDSFLAIDICQYAIADMSFAGCFQYPQYLINLLDSSFILSDCMYAIGLNAFMSQNQNLELNTLLDYMVFRGKILYFMNEVLPDVSLEKNLRYTSDQLAWANENEGNVWGYIVQNQLLYSTDNDKLRDFVDDAPKTPQFNNSAPRLADFLGMKIIEKYVEKTDCSMQELFAENNSQKILSTSGYKPARK